MKLGDVPINIILYCGNGFPEQESIEVEKGTNCRQVLNYLYNNKSYGKSLRNIEVSLTICDPRTCQLP
eukprot:UN04549